MDSKVQEKIEGLLERFKQLEEELGKPDVFDDQKRYRELTREHSYLGDVKVAWESVSKLSGELADNRSLLKEETDPEFQQVLQEDISLLEEKLPLLEKKLQTLLVPPDPNDDRNTMMEIRAGTGGDEAALFVGDCLRMYRLFADANGWKYEILSSTPSDAGGYKEVVALFSGKGVHRFLQYEAGTHRVQRVPETESQGRVHTSAITVAVLPELEDDDEVVLDAKDLRVDTYRASGAGGQHVNTTDSAVRITHEPTGIVCYCSQEKSQHKNKDKAMRLLKIKIGEVERQKKEAEIASARASMVGSGDRSERIRTYNFPQNRITDHRINLTLYNLDRAVDGALEELTQALVAHFYQMQLAS